MSLIANCLQKLVDAKRITQKAADDALALHEGIMGRLEESMGPSSADAGAALETARIMAQAAREKKLRVAKNAIRLNDGFQRLQNHPQSELAGLYGMMTRDIYDHGGIHIEKQTEVIRNKLLAMADPLARAYQSKWAGTVQDTDSIWNMVDERFGADTGDEVAKAAWKAFQETSEYAVSRVKREGKQLSVLEDWGMPQFWETGRIRSFSADEFINDVMGFYENGGIKVMDKNTGTEAGQAAVHGIIANMQDDILVGRNGTAGAFSNQFRVIRFQNADAYKFLMKKYGPGSGGLYKMFLGHINAMAREIALVEIFGPNYAANFRQFHERASSARVRDDAKKGIAQKAVSAFNPVRAVENPRHAEKVFRYLTGDLGIVEREMVAAIGGGIRNLSTAARLGSATISAVPGDTVTSSLAANYNGMAPTAVLTRLLKSVGKDETALLKRLNLTAASMIDTAIGSKRFEDEIVGAGVTGRIADTTMRISAIQAWTESSKRAFTLEFMGMIADQASKHFGDIDPSFGKFLKRYGFNEKEWDEIRAAELLDYDGATYFDPGAIENQRLSDRLMGAIFDERQFAVIEPDARIRALTQNDRRGTLAGELGRTAFMFKSFPLTVMTTHLMRAALTGPIHERAYRTAAYLVLMSMGGAVALQASSLITGKDPMAMDDPQFWKAAFMRGGALGFYGDFFYSAQTRGGAGVAEFLGGPVAGPAVDVAGRLVQGKMDGKSLARHMKAFTPGSTLWFARAAVDRMIFDQIQSLIDPDYENSLARHENRILREFDQEFWWRRGETTPDRGPDFGASLPR